MMAINATRQHCLISLLVLLILLGSLGVVTVLPWWNKMSFYHDKAAQSVSRIVRYEHLIKNQPAYEEQMRQFGRQQTAKGYLINASDPDLAAAQLQRRLKEITKDNGATLSSTQNLPASGDDEVGRIVIRARINGNADALTGVLRALENGRPLLTVENLSIRSRQKRARKRGKATAASYELNVNLDIVGYMRGTL